MWTLVKISLFEFQVQQHQYSIDPHQQMYLSKGAVSTAEMGQVSSQKSDAPCLNCRLIQMGSAISYGDNRCPQCGEQVS